MNIQIRVMSRTAQAEIKRLEVEIAGLQRQMLKTSGASKAMQGGIVDMMTTGNKAGSQLQWIGRQLMYNFTLPLAVAGGAATKWSLNNEAAMTRVRKVYGDGSAVFNNLSKTELPALGRAFEALSNHFGIAQADAINIAADWAAAGASGLALAKAVKLTMETMILGEMDAASATQALIAIQAQYGQSVDDLSKTIDILNMVENQTGVTMEGLIQGMARAAGVARSSGVDVRHLAAFIAALSPAAGSAVDAGNALKTMISRLMSPTQEAKQVMGLMGVNIADIGWKSLNATQRIETMSKKFQGLSDAQKAVVSSVIASRWQINRFDVLMRDIINTNGYYQKALQSTGSELGNFNQRQRELNAVLTSNPQRLKQIWVILQNALADVIQPLIPAMVYLAGRVANLMTAFSRLNPSIQKMILAGLGAVAFLGLFIRYLGAMRILLNMVEVGFLIFSRVLSGPVLTALKVVLSPIALMGRAILGVGMIALNLPALIMSGISASVGVFGAMIPALSTVATAAVGLIGAMVDGMFLVVTSTFAALGPVMAAIGGGLSMIWAGILTVFGGEFAVFRTAIVTAWASWLGLMKFILGPAGMALNVIWGAILTGMELMTVTWRLAMLSIMSWWGTGMLNVTKAIGMAIAELWRTLMLTIAFITEVASKQIPIIWRAMLTGIQALTFGFGIAMAAIWRGIVLVARTAAFGMGGAAAIMTRGMMGIVTSPARLLGVFAGGMRGLMMVMSGGLRSMAMVSMRIIPLIFSSPIGWAIAIALALAYKFRDRLANIWTQIVAGAHAIPRGFQNAFAGIANFFGQIGTAIEKVFWQLPSSITGAMMAVIRVVQAAAMAVYHLFSYLNPFAHHSPSLVESVTNGMAVIRAQYASVGNVGSIFARAARDLASYKSIASSLGAGPFASQRQDVAKAFKSALPVFDALVGDYNRLTVAQNQQQAAVDRQQAVVDKWKASLDAANKELDSQQKKLDGLKNNLQTLQDAYDQAQSKMQDFASAPIKGMGAMSDAIFENGMAQKQLQLQMMQWQDVNGSLDATTNKIAALAGTIESTQSEIANLRAGGAGSDILGPMNAQLDAMNAQHDQLQKSVQNSPMTEMQKQLDALDRKGQELDLQNSLQFDPLTRQVDKLANGMKELPFDDIIAGIKNQQAAMNALQPQMDQAQKAVDDQTAAVDAATKARDALSAQYDVETAKLDLLKQGYQDIADTISKVEDALRSMGSAASDANQAAAAKQQRMSPGAQNFLDAAGGNFPEVGGTAKIGREGALTDQSAQIDQFTKDITNQTAGMFGKFDMFAPLKDMWKQAWTWIEKNAMPYITPVITTIKTAFGSIGNPFGSGGGSWLKDTFGGWPAAIKGYLQPVTDIFVSIYHGAMKVWELFAPDITKIFNTAVTVIMQIWNKLGPHLAAFIPLIMPLFTALKNFIAIALGPIFLYLLGVIKIVVSILANTLGPVLSYLVNTLANELQVLRGVLEIFIGLFTGDWSMMWDGVKLIFSGIWNQIINIFTAIPAVLWGIAKGLVEGIYGYFKWLLSMAPQPVQDMFSAIGGFFSDFYGYVAGIFGSIGGAFGALWDGMKMVWDKVGKPIFDFIVSYLKGEFTVFKWIWDNIINPEWNLIWGTMKRVWETIGLIFLIAIVAQVKIMAAVFGWVWSNVIKPAWDLIWGGLALGWNSLGKPLMDLIVAGVRLLGQFFQFLWRDYISPGWSAFTGGIGPAWTKYGKPVIDGIVTAATTMGNFFKNLWINYVKPGWDGLWGGVGTTWTKIGKPIFSSIVTAVNTVLRAINALTGGLNKVGGSLGIGLKIDPIPLLPAFAAGGQLPSRQVGAGFVTSQARAIVGEGGPFPEYVIPTDPKYRDRAMQLFASLGNKMGLFEDGGILGKIGDAAGSAWGAVTGAAGKVKRGAIDLLFKPFDLLANQLINQVPIKFFRDVAKGELKKIEDLVKGVNDKGASALSTPGAPADSRANVALGKQIAESVKGWGHGPEWDAMYAQLQFESGWNNTAQNPTSTAYGIGQFLDSTWAGVGLSKTSDPATQIRGYLDYVAGRYGDPVSSWNFEKKNNWYRDGGIANKPTPGVFGEAGPEVLAPLAPLWNRFDRLEARMNSTVTSNGGGDTIININGNLEFPNIDTAEDAEAFIRNLEIVAKR